MMNTNMKAIFIILIMIFVSSHLYAFNNNAVGSISLSVTSNGSPAPNIKILVLSTTSPVYSYENNTDMNGSLVITEVPVGGVLITVMDDSRNALAQYSNVTVIENEQLNLKLTL